MVNSGLVIGFGGTALVSGLRSLWWGFVHAHIALCNVNGRWEWLAKIVSTSMWRIVAFRSTSLQIAVPCALPWEMPGSEFGLSAGGFSSCLYVAHESCVYASITFDTIDHPIWSDYLAELIKHKAFLIIYPMSPDFLRVTGDATQLFIVLQFGNTVPAQPWLTWVPSRWMHSKIVYKFKNLSI